MNNIVLITGATSGFGEACARLFASKGHDLILLGRRTDRLDSLKAELTKAHKRNIMVCTVDVRNEEQVNNTIENFSPEVKSSLTILVNNAGLAVGRGSINEGTTEDWNRMIDTNVKGLLYVTRAVVPILIQNGQGHIINMASVAGKEVYPGGNVYCASKHAVDALSRAMRIDLVEHNIKVTNIAPGAAETEFSIVRFKGDEAAAKTVYDGYVPLNAHDVADAVYYAASRPAHVHIQDIVITPAAQASTTVFNKKA